MGDIIREIIKIDKLDELDFSKIQYMYFGETADGITLFYSDGDKEELRELLVEVPDGISMPRIFRAEKDFLQELCKKADESCDCTWRCSLNNFYLEDSPPIMFNCKYIKSFTGISSSFPVKIVFEDGYEVRYLEEYDD